MRSVIKYAYKIVTQKITTILPALLTFVCIIFIAFYFVRQKYSSKNPNYLEILVFAVPYCGKDILMIKEIRSNVCLIEC